MAEGNRADGFDSDCNSDKDSFLEYVESMIRFRRSHDDIEVINSLRFDGAALVESMPPMQASRIVTMIETGGSRIPSSTMDWSVLVPILRVVRYKLSQN